MYETESLFFIHFVEFHSPSFSKGFWKFYDGIETFKTGFPDQNRPFMSYLLLFDYNFLYLENSEIFCSNRSI